MPLLKLQHTIIGRRKNSTKQLFRAMAAALLLTTLLAGGCTQKWEIDNLYEGINWETEKQYKANFHTHTTGSDGRMNPQTVVDKYHQLGYSVLALTDHNRVTYPWTAFETLEASRASKERLEQGALEEADLNYENRDPQRLGMLAIQGNELSSHHHMGSFFSDHNHSTSEEESLKATAEKGGLTVLFHPGKYNKPIDWYVKLYQQYDHLIGIEVTQQGNRYPGDRMKWDSILTVTMPLRPVWGFSNDDMHTGAQLGTNWNMLVMNKPSEQAVNDCLKEGRFFYLYSPAGHQAEIFPTISNIHVNHKKQTITLQTTAADSICWISAGKTIARGRRLSLKSTSPGSYVRAEVYGPEGILLGTQPFGIRAKTD